METETKRKRGERGPDVKPRAPINRKRTAFAAVIDEARARMAEAGQSMTISKLAEAAEINPATLHRAMSGATRLRPPNLEALARALEMDVLILNEAVKVMP